MASQPASLRDISLVASQGLFDADYYVRQAPTLAGQPPTDLIRHYLEHGWTEGLDPHPLFLMKFYLEKFSDVAKEGVNPLVHYLKYGSNEGRTPHPLFNDLYYKTHHVKGDGFGLAALAHYVKIGVPAGYRPNEFFMPGYYNEQLRRRGLTARYLLDHYMKSGWREGIATSPLFDTAYYLLSNPDVRESAFNPLEHYLFHGRWEGRPGSALGDKIDHTQDVNYPEWMEMQQYLLPAPPHFAPREAGLVELKVVVSVHNAMPASVEGCLESLWAQHCRGARLIIFDDCTTSAGVRKIIDEYRKKDPEIRIVPQSGQIHAWQESLAARPDVVPEFLLHLDCTELLARDGIARIKSAIASSPDSKLFVLPSPAQRLRQGLDWQSTMVIHRELLATAARAGGEVDPQYGLLPSSAEAPLTYREFLRLSRGVAGVRPAVDWSKPHLLDAPARKTVNIYVHSEGNFFFGELADLLTSAFRELGWTSTRCDESAYLTRKATLNLIVAPHEFFTLLQSQTGKEPQVPGNTILLNTEQPWTHWFQRACHFFPKALKIWDMNYTSYRRLVSLGYDCAYLPLGSLQSQNVPQEVPALPRCGRSIILPESVQRFSCLTQPWDRRPIDILFIGGLSPKRCDLFARNAAFFNRHECYLHFADNSEPLLIGKNTEMTPDMTIGLIQRSKIMLNIHRGDELYFEWHRIVMQGIANGAVVLTEPCTPAVPFVDGSDFLTAELEDFPDVLESLLTTAAGIEKARSIAASGQRKYYTDCKIRSHLSDLLQKL